MIVGLGLDTTILSRFTNLINNKRFIKRILTTQEESEFYNIKECRRANFLAKRFSGKEAFAKALGTGIGGVCSFKSIAILKTTQNAPFIIILDEKISQKISTSFIAFSDEKLGNETIISSVVILQNIT
jgi:holo-[acyl-carrier protein] synthase